MKRALHRIALAVASFCSAAAHAQSTPPPGSPSDVRYTPLGGTASPLYPKGGDLDSPPGTSLDSIVAKPGFVAASAVGRITVEVDKNAVPADGQSPVKFVVHLFDKQGAPLKTSVFLTIEHSGGRILLPGARTDELGPRRQDADRSVPGVQLKSDNGVAEFTLLAPFEAQDVRLRITGGSEEATGTVSFVPEMRPMVAAGLIEGIVNLHGRTTVNAAQSGDGFEQAIQSWSRQFDEGKANVAARTAFYLKGTIKGDVLLTASYDSDKDTRTRLLRDIDPDGLYPVYGDASLRSFDARSTERLYLRLDKGKDYVLYGDFVTGDGFTQPIGQGAVASLKQRSLGNYNRTSTGIRAHKEDDTVLGNVWAFHDSLRQIVQEFASQGSGPYGLANNSVLEGSEKVEVIVRDRQNTSRIISVTPLVRLVDYTFEPFSGRILLSTFLPSVDANLNPVSLRVTYEVDQGGEQFWVYGGDAQVKLSPQIELGGSVVHDENDLAHYKLYSANATWTMGPKTALVVEVARTESEINTIPTNMTTTPALAGRVGDVGGQAWRVEFAHEGEKTEARAFLGRSDPEFNNPAAPLDAGRGEGQASASYKLTDSVKAYGEGVMSEDRNPGGGDRKIGGVGLRWAASEKLTVDVGFRVARETIGTQGNGVSSTPFGSTVGLTGSIASGSGGGALGYGNQPLDPSTGLPVIAPSSGLAPAVSNLAPGTELESDTVHVGVGYKLTDRIVLGGEVEHDVSGDEKRLYAIGGDYQVNDRTKVYARFERQEGWAYLQGVTSTGQSANALVLGVDSTIVKDTQVYSEYRLRDAIDDRDLQLASGVRNFWDVKEGLRLTTAFEHVTVMSGATPASNAGSIGLDYSADPLWRGSTRIEVRRSGDIADTPLVNEQFTTILGQAMVARKLDRDWTLLARDYLLKTDYVDRGDIVQNRAQLGVAYRDTDTNRINALGKVEWKDEIDASNAAVGTLKTNAIIATTHADWHPSRPWWLTGRVAAKWERDQFEQGVQSRFTAQLVAGRAVYDISENWDLGVLAAAQLGQSGATQYASGVEVGYLLKQNLWLSAGLNVTGFKGDADLTGYEYVQRGVYLRLRFKFDETLFKGRDTAANPSPRPMRHPLARLGFAVALAFPAMAMAQATTLAPQQERISDQVIQQDYGAYEQLQARIKALNDGGRRVADYHLSKAQCWLDVSFHEYTRNDRSAFPQAAMTESEKLVVAMETRVSPLPDETPLVNGAARLRPDLWERTRELMQSSGFVCAAQKIACAEVELVHAGNEYNQQQWRHAKPYVQIAEEEIAEASSLAEQCHPVAAPVVAAAAPSASVAPPVVTVDDRVVLNAGVVFNFDRSDRADIRAIGREQIDGMLRSVGGGSMRIVSVRLIGHADRLNGTGHAAYNQRLSEKRAATVRALLIERGVDAGLITTEATGDAAQVAPCRAKPRSKTELEECLLPNRRVEIVLVAGRTP